MATKLPPAPRPSAAKAERWGFGLGVLVLASVLAVLLGQLEIDRALRAGRLAKGMTEAQVMGVLGPALDTKRDYYVVTSRVRMLYAKPTRILHFMGGRLVAITGAEEYYQPSRTQPAPAKQER